MKTYTEFTICVEDDNEVVKHIYLKWGFTDAIDKGYGNELEEYINKKGEEYGNYRSKKFSKNI